MYVIISKVSNFCWSNYPEINKGNVENSCSCPHSNFKVDCGAQNIKELVLSSQTAESMDLVQYIKKKGSRIYDGSVLSSKLPSIMSDIC